MTKSYAYYAFPGWKMKAFTTSFDDGNTADGPLAELLRQYGAKGTFNVNSASLLRPVTEHKKQWYRMYADQMQEIYGEDMEIAAHGLNHGSWGEQTLSEVAYEIMEDRRNLEKLTGRIIRGCATPNSSVKFEYLDVLRMAGMAYCRITGGSTLKLSPMPEDFIAWRPTVKYCHESAAAIAKKFAELEPGQCCKMLCVWGHTHEFIKRNDGYLMEEILKIVGNRPDVWYATNLEIADYMETIRLLRYSADGMRIYNPSAQTAYLRYGDGEDVCKNFEVPGGTTVEVPQ